MSDEPIEIARQRERALLEEEGIYRQVLDAIADMVLVKGAHSRILWANKAFRDYYGMTNEELQELVDAPFNAPDNTQQYVADDRLVFTTGKTLEIPMERVTRHDGVVGLFHTVKSPIRDDDGQVRMTVGVSRNVAETVELREELLRARAQLERDRLSAFAAQLPGFLFQLRVVGTHAQFTFVSARVAEYYGVSASDLRASAGRFYDCIEDPDRVRDELRRTFSETSGLLSHVHRARGADGTWRWMELLARVQREPDGSITYHGYAHDVTERRRSEAEREALVAKLEARNREMEQFTYTISHDLKSPLVTIRGFVSGIEEDLRAGRLERALADLGRVRAASEKMSRMLSELLELSRVGRVAHVPSEIRVGDAIAEARELISARLAMRPVGILIEGEDVRVHADRTRLVQVFQNLLENAVKYMGDQPAPMLRVRCWDEGTDVRIDVVDNGMGIAPAHHQRIFGLFEKLDPRAEGSGVGLALVKSIVELHRGEIWVDSEGPGRGATFHLRLPRG
ncbi:MAG: PAS domain S-box protein [Sandaracinaceae bacterium]|nr:PAS domain S-box protein [Sandaracinaceae bacterium]